MGKYQSSQIRRWEGLLQRDSGGAGLSSRNRLQYLLIVLCLGGCKVHSTNVEPKIEFSQIPRAAPGGPEKFEPVGGRVAGARPGQRIVLFAKSGRWWVQPLASQPFTEIRADSTWTNRTHLGTEYAALLVEPGYKPPPTTHSLPAKGGAVAAITTIKGDRLGNPGRKMIRFSGYEWDVRDVPSTRGGVANDYDPANAWTDDKGRLHLKIAKSADQDAPNWTCAEVTLRRSLGYGSYSFIVNDVSSFEPATVLGIYTWDAFSEDQNRREMDIEFSRWGDPQSKNTQYTVQPYYVPVNLFRFTTPAGVMTHSLRWEPGRTSFRSLRGGKSVRGGGAVPRSSAVAGHVFTSGVPTPGSETIRLSFYVYGKTRTPLKNEAEVVIDKFEYLP
jgi:hypothetical protein